MRLGRHCEKKLDQLLMKLIVMETFINSSMLKKSMDKCP
jgi:hypothetical protein